MTVVYDQQIEVTKEQYLVLTNHFGCPHRIVDGKYYVKVWHQIKEIETYLNETTKDKIID